MAEVRSLVTELIIKNASVNTTEIDVFGRHMAKAAQAAASGSKVMETASTQSTARIKANLDRLTASFDPLSQATFKIQQDFERSVKTIDLARRRDVLSADEHARHMTQLTTKRLEEINRVQTAVRTAANQNFGVGGGGFGAGGSAMNAAFQGQDILMMTAAGQSPITMALQQGTQLAGVLAQVRQEGGNVGGTLADAFMSILSPMSLVTIAGTALVGIVGQYGLAWLTSGEQAELTLEEQTELLDTLNEKYGKALGLVHELAEARKAEAQAAQIDQGVLQSETDKRRALMLERIGQMRQLIPGFGTMGPNGQMIDPAMISAAGQAVSEFQREAAAGEISTESFATVSAALLLVYQGMPEALARTRQELRLIEAAYDDLSIAIRTQRGAATILGAGTYYREDFFPGGTTVESARVRDEAEQRRRQAMLRVTEDARRDFFRQFVGSQQTGIEASERARRNAFRDLRDPSSTHDTSKFATDAAKSLEDQRRATEKLLETEAKRAEQTRDFLAAAEDKAQMAELELATMGMAEDARDRLISQMQVEQQLAKTNIVLTQEQADAVREYAARATEAKIQTDANKEALSDLNDQQKFAADQGMKLFDAWIEGGKELTDVFKDIANAIADAILQAVLFGQGPLAGFFGTKPAAGYDIGGIVGTILGNKAAGGPSAGQTAMQAVAAGSGWEGLRGTGALTGNMATYAQAIKMIESSGNYGALGQIQRNGDQALGAYQVMESNLPSWTRMSFGRSIGRNEFLSNPAIQDQIFRDRFGSSLSRYGNPQDAASVWFTGRPMGASTTPDSLGTTPNVYVQKFNAELARASGTLPAFTAQTVQATGGVGQLANVLTQFPAAPAAPAGGGGIGSWFANLFGGGSALSPAASAAISGGYAGGLYAMGAAFRGGNVIPFASGGIIGGPMLFPMARGAGLMGEAGPEAVLPLARTASGKLGVATSGGGVSVVINNLSTGEVKTRQTEPHDGRLGLEVVIEDRTADRINTFGTNLNKSVRSATAGRLKRR